MLARRLPSRVLSSALLRPGAGSGSTVEDGDAGERGWAAGPARTGLRAGARPRLPLRRLGVRGGAHLRGAAVRAEAPPRPDGPLGGPHRAHAAAARADRGGALAHAAG